MYTCIHPDASLSPTTIAMFASASTNAGNACGSPRPAVSQPGCVSRRWRANAPSASLFFTSTGITCVGGGVQAGGVCRGGACRQAVYVCVGG
eukprot:345483-Chlamydomonas_euryale.AAC.12